MTTTTYLSCKDVMRAAASSIITDPVTWRRGDAFGAEIYVGEGGHYAALSKEAGLRTQRIDYGAQQQQWGATVTLPGRTLMIIEAASFGELKIAVDMALALDLVGRP